MPASSESTKAASKKAARREFFSALAGIGSGTVGGLIGMKLLTTGKVEAAEVPPPLAEPTGNVMVRMQQDLEQSLVSGKTPNWLMVVDTRKCIGCDACTVACRAENPTGPAGNFRRVIKRELIGARPWAIYKPVNCLQCDDPPCAKAVPQGMVVKRPDGIVEFDSDKLGGQYAQAVTQACPLRLAHIDDGKTFTQSTPQPQAYENRTFIEGGKVHSRNPQAGTMPGVARKCNFCSHLLEAGMLPACVTTCVGGAMYFGDAGNANSLIVEITQGRREFKGHENLGIKPRVIYFTESMPDTPHIDCAACH